MNDLLDKQQGVIFEGDARMIAARLFADLIVTDPPYASLERHRAKGTTTRLKDSKASSNEWFKPLSNRDLFYYVHNTMYIAAKKNSHAFVFCDNETEHVLLNRNNPFWLEDPLNQLPVTPPQYWRAWPSLVWVKIKRAAEQATLDDVAQESIRCGMGYHKRRAHESILFLEKGKRALNTKNQPSVFLSPVPTPAPRKPTKLIEQLILDSSNVGDVVFDPFAGTGATGEAAIACQRRAVLCEISPTKCAALRELFPNFNYVKIS